MISNPVPLVAPTYSIQPQVEKRCFNILAMLLDGRALMVASILKLTDAQYSYNDVNSALCKLRRAGIVERYMVGTFFMGWRIIPKVGIKRWNNSSINVRYHFERG